MNAGANPGFDISPPHAERIGQLKHHWLQNTILAWNPEEVAHAWATSGWPELIPQCEARIAQMDEVVRGLIDGFSPAQLVDRLRPLSALPSATKREMRETVHAAYLDRSGIAAVHTQLKDAVDILKKELHLLSREWGNPISKSAETAIRVQWGRVQDAAKSAVDILDRLPKTVVLP